MSGIDLALRPAEWATAGRLHPAASRPRDDADTLVRFVDGLCRAAGAVGGCLIVDDDTLADGERQILGRVAVDAAADAALTVLLHGDRVPSRRGHIWLRDAATPIHSGLMLDASAPHRTIFVMLMLVFERDRLNADDMQEGVLTIAPGLAIAAGAMYETWLASSEAAERHRLLAAAMNQSECGILVIRADHSVSFSNPAAQAILALRDGIELRRDQLRPTRYQDAIRFQAALDHVLTLPAEAGGPSRHSMMLLLDRPGALRPLIAVIAPAAAESAEGGAAAIVYVMRPELSGLRGVEAICQLHGLSPVETQLVARLVAGATLIEAATDMRIKPDTARAYLKQVFAKTDTHRQADLIQLVIRYQRAVRGDFLFHAA